MATIDEQRDGAEMVKALREWGEERTGVRKGYSALLSKPVTTGVVPTEDEVRSFASGYCSRDAEVQALREALTYALHVLECLKAESHNPMLPHSRWKSVDMARAALEQEAAE